MTIHAAVRKLPQGLTGRLTEVALGYQEMLAENPLHPQALVAMSLVALASRQFSGLEDRWEAHQRAFQIELRRLFARRRLRGMVPAKTAISLKPQPCWPHSTWPLPPTHGSLILPVQWPSRSGFCFPT